MMESKVEISMEELDEIFMLLGDMNENEKKISYTKFI